MRNNGRRLTKIEVELTPRQVDVDVLSQERKFANDVACCKATIGKGQHPLASRRELDPALWPSHQQHQTHLSLHTLHLLGDGRLADAS